MKKNLKFFVSSALVAITFLIPQTAYSAEDLFLKDKDKNLVVATLKYGPQEANEAPQTIVGEEKENEFQDAIKANEGIKLLKNKLNVKNENIRELEHKISEAQQLESADKQLIKDLIEEISERDAGRIWITKKKIFVGAAVFGAMFVTSMKIENWKGISEAATRRAGSATHEATPAELGLMMASAMVRMLI